MINSPYKDSPNSLTDENNRIDLSFKRNGTSGTISWTIPQNLDNPNAPPVHYNGILLLLDNKPIVDKPINQKKYQDDTTVDRNRHVGDIIGNSLVIGSLYNDITTNSITITDLNDNDDYYIAGFSVDNVTSYSTPIFSYQLPLKLNKDNDSTAGYHVIKLGILPEDEITIDNDLYLNIDNKDYTLHIVANTYQELVDDINFNLNKIDNPYIGNEPKNNNGFYLTNNTLYQFDGVNDIKQECFFGVNPPNQIADGTYWITDDKLSQWNNNKWDELNVIRYTKPTLDLEDGDYWYDGNNAYRYDGYIWKKLKTSDGKDPSITKTLKNNAIWYNGKDFFKYTKEKCNSIWNNIDVFYSENNPLTYLNGYYWLKDNKIYQLINKVWTLTDIITGKKPDVFATVNWYDGKSVYQYNTLTLEWDLLPISIITFGKDVTIGDEWYWYDGKKLYTYDKINTQWVSIAFTTNKEDPTLSKVKKGDAWLDDVLKIWDGSQWQAVDYIDNSYEPKLLNGVYYQNVINKQYVQFNGPSWNDLQGCNLSFDPSLLATGQYWYDTSKNTLYVWNGLTWQSLMYSSSSLKPQINDLWYNTSTKQLLKFNKFWEETFPRAVCVLENGDIKISSTSLGSKSILYMLETFENSYNLFNYTSPRGSYQEPVKGTDSIKNEPLYKQVGVGTDGSYDERRNIIDNIMRLLGYPAVSVELDKSQLELAVDLGLAMFRKLSGSSYERALFFLDLKNNIQQYYLTDETIGYNKIVNVQAVYRRNSAYMSSASGNGIYAQQLLQWMYNPTMGFDLTSYHIISEYTELMDTLFATRIVSRFNERTRRLDIYQNIGLPERVILDTTIERTENELFMDRISGTWILNWSLGEACLMLANIRGKYSNVPGAGGSVSLNSGDLVTRANDLFEKCRYDIDNFIANEPEKIGLESTIVWG
jgi:hypothetical protein